MPKVTVSASKPDRAALQGAQLVRSPGAPLHEQLRSVLRDIITDQFEAGDPFFTESVLETHFQVSKITVRRALEDLSRDGLISRRRGTASVVNAVPITSAPAANAPVERPSVSSALNPNQSRRITGIIVDSLGGEYNSLLIAELSRASIAQGIQVRCYLAPTAAMAADIYTSLSQSQDEHSFVLFSQSDVMEFLNHVLLGSGHRTVSIESVDLDAPYPYIMTDSRAAVTLGVEHLLSLGHRRIALLVHEDPAHPTVRVKIARFHELVTEHGLEGHATVFLPDFRKVDGPDLNAGAMQQLWSELDVKPTAIMTVSDFGAWSTMDWLIRNRINVPGVVSVLGFENVYTSQFTRPKLTTIAHPARQIAARVIQALWSDSYDARLHELIPPYLVVRESTGKVDSG